MAKAKKKPKFPADREMQSNASKENRISYHRFTSIPKLDIFINMELTDSAIADIKNAIDDVLHHHSL